MPLARAAPRRNTHFKALRIRALKLAFFHSSETCRSTSVRRHRQREIREDDFSLTSGDVCAPAQTSGVKNIASAIFFTLCTATEKGCCPACPACDQHPFSGILVQRCLPPYSVIFLRDWILYQLISLLHFSSAEGTRN